MKSLSEELWELGVAAAQEHKREVTEREHLLSEVSEVFTEGRIWPVKPNIKND